MSTINKKLLTATVCLTLSGLSALAYADTDSILAANRQFGLQIGGQNIHYDEKDSAGVLLDSEYGSQKSVGLSVSTMGDYIFGKDYFQAQYSYAWGTTRYIGQLINVTNSYGSLRLTSDAKTNDLSLRYGKGFSPASVIMLTPYVELGSHQWARNVGGGAPSGYMENYSHKYFGLGLLGQYSPTQNLVFSGTFMLGKTFDAYLTANIPSFASNWALGSNHTIYKAGLGADYAFTKTVHGNIAVDYTAWKYGISAVNGFGLQEPDSVTKIATYKLGIGYAF